MEKSIHFDAFYAAIADLIASPDVRRMDTFGHHYHVTCLEHSISVAYLSYLIVRKLGGNARAAARGGLLHDFFLYDRRTPGSHEGFHGTAHPKVALLNALERFTLTDLECEIIRTHMFPVGRDMPRHLESVVVSLVDKACAVYEVTGIFAISTLYDRVEEIMA